MTRRRLALAAIGAATAILITPAIGTAAQAATADTTPPTAPYIVYSQGFFCFTLYIGAQKSTDNVTPQTQLRYEAFANGQFIGLLDRDSGSSIWGNLKLKSLGPNRVFVDAVDAAGNRSHSNTNTVTGYHC
jgi:hypothetical protein